MFATVGAGFVTRFEMDAAFAQRYPIHTVAVSVHAELLVPAEDPEDFNPSVGSTKSRSDFGRRERVGPERSGGRAAVPGREQSHPLRHSF